MSQVLPLGHWQTEPMSLTNQVPPLPEQELIYPSLALPPFAYLLGQLSFVSTHVAPAAYVEGVVAQAVPLHAWVPTQKLLLLQSLGWTFVQVELELAGQLSFENVSVHAPKVPDAEQLCVPGQPVDVTVQPMTWPLEHAAVHFALGISNVFPFGQLHG